MKLQDLTPDVVRAAVSAYMSEAYGAAPARGGGLEVREGAGCEEILRHFTDDTRKDRNVVSHRYSLRLGNRNYPFMKLVIQEHLVAGEYFFAVDSHDEMDVKPTYPDYASWAAVREFNATLKRRIEERWAEGGIPTYASIRELVLGRPLAGEGSRAERILVVDDERDMADTVEHLLAGRGFRVAKVHDGRSALREAAARPPDLIVLDYEMPEMDGLAVMEDLRAREATRHIPILLATAGGVDFQVMALANGFLGKPFDEEALYLVVESLLAGRKV